jgi:hypothetical protein
VKRIINETCRSGLACNPTMIWASLATELAHASISGIKLATEVLRRRTARDGAPDTSCVGGGF